MTKELVPIHNEQMAYSEIIPTMLSGSTFDEISAGVFEYKRKNGIAFDNLVIKMANGARVDYTLDSRSNLTYKTLPGPAVILNGSVYDRQPQR